MQKEPSLIKPVGDPYHKLKIFLLGLGLLVIVEVLASIGYATYLSVFPAKQTNPIVVPSSLTNPGTSTADFIVPPSQTGTTNCKAEDVYTDLSEAVKNQNKVCGLNLVGKMPGTFDPRIFQMTQIKVLRLGTNNLKVLPAELFNLKNLVNLGLIQNGLTMIPADIAKLTNLKILNLADNNLTTLPDEVSQLTALEQLVLSGNNFSVIEKKGIQQLIPSVQIDF